MAEKSQYGLMECIEEVETTPDAEMISLREILDGFDFSRDTTDDVYSHEKGNLWNVMNGYEDLEHRMIQYVQEIPGRSYSAIFEHFKEEGFTHTDILETYNILVYDKKILLRINVGTAASPRYAHFVAGFLVSAGKDALYEILGPI